MSYKFRITDYPPTGDLPQGDKLRITKLLTFIIFMLL